jgi:CO/xanthine dehydrogenase FAD-binding subunit
MSLAGITAYLTPPNLAEAYAALGEGAIPISGGTDAILHAPPGTAILVDLAGLPLRYIRHEGGFALGATTTLTEILEHPGLARHMNGVIPAMLRQVGSPLLRNAATIGGHLARGRLSDVVPVFLALDASLAYYDGGEHTVPLSRFYGDGLYKNRVLITEVTIPPAAPRSAASFLKLSRTAFDMAQLNCATAVTLSRTGLVTSCRIVVGETPALGAAVVQAERALEGRGLEDEAIAAAAASAAAAIPAGSDQRASAEYRRALCSVAVRRCLEDVRSHLDKDEK